MTAARKSTLICASILYLAVLVVCYLFLDRPIALWCHRLAPEITRFFSVITVLGDSAWPLVAAALFFLFFRYVTKNRRQATRAVFVFAAVALSGLATNLLKWIGGRWRPRMFITEGQFGFSFFQTIYEQTSFPSGHATTIVALAAALAALFPRDRWLWYLVAVLVSVSRVVIGSHYLSDVLAGTFVGILTVFLLRKEPRIRDCIGAGRQTVEAGNNQDH